MLSFNNLGNLGRLANQMFQYASLKGIARNRGYDFCIPPKNVFGQVDELVRNDNLNIYDVFDLIDKGTALSVLETLSCFYTNKWPYFGLSLFILF